MAKQRSNEIRSLLWIWFAGQTDEPPTQAQVVRKLKRKAEKAADYRKALQGLVDDGALVIKDKGCVITEQGKARLGQGLLKSEFELSGTIVGTWVANALLAWLRSGSGQQSGSVSAAVQSGRNGNGSNGNGSNGNGSNGNGSNGKSGGMSIGSYEDFQAVALKTYDRLNQDYNLDDLVPIYRIRRELGDRLSRSDFNTWLLEMQAQDLVQLIGGEMPELTPDKAEDSITTRMGAMRYYAKRL